MMDKIQANISGTKSIDVSGENLQTIDKYMLLQQLADSNGIIEESTLEKLRMNVRALLESDANKDKALLDLCLDVIYHKHMKAFGLQKLVALYDKWKEDQPK